MRRVLVIGICGAGKSTFSQVLAARTGLPLIHLDTTYGGVRADMAPDCPEQLDPGFLHYIWTFNARKRPLIVAALAEFGWHIEPVVFHRDHEVRQFLEQQT